MRVVPNLRPLAPGRVPLLQGPSMSVCALGRLIVQKRELRGLQRTRGFEQPCWVHQAVRLLKLTQDLVSIRTEYHRSNHHLALLEN
jgi:hypothetical protein